MEKQPKRLKKVSGGPLKEVWETDGTNSLEVVYLEDRGLRVAKKNTSIACRHFDFLKSAGISTGYNGRVSPTSFLSYRRDQIPLRINVRRYERSESPESKLFRFSELVIEFFLETEDKKFQGEDLGIDNPLINNPLADNWLLQGLDGKVLEKKVEAVKACGNLTIAEIRNTAKKIFLLLEKAWSNLGFCLYDLELRFDTLLQVSRAIDSESFRIFRQNQWLGKPWLDKEKSQAIDLDTLSELSIFLCLPRQFLFFWQDQAEALPLNPKFPGLNFVTARKEFLSRNIGPLRGEAEKYPDGAVIIINLGKEDSLNESIARLMANESSFPIIGFYSDKEKSGLIRPVAGSKLLIASCSKTAMENACRILGQKNPVIYAQL